MKTRIAYKVVFKAMKQFVNLKKMNCKSSTLKKACTVVKRNDFEIVIMVEEIKRMIKIF